jgi:hypothetical protein
MLESRCYCYCYCGTRTCVYGGMPDRAASAERAILPIADPAEPASGESSGGGG